MLRFYRLLTAFAVLAASGCGGSGATTGPVTGAGLPSDAVPISTATPTTASATSSPTGVPMATSQLPCDIYANAGAPCVAAHSTTRRLVNGYRGSLYRVTRTADKATLDIGMLADGYADAAKQDGFCSTQCTITTVYDQTTYGNNLSVAGPGGNAGADTGVIADQLPVVAGGHKVYGMYFASGNGYRIEHTVGVATGAAPESLYMLASGTHVNGSCCFDYGNAEANALDNGNGHMDAIYFGTSMWFEWPIYYGSGPWVQVDMENGLVMSDQGYSMNSSYTGSPSAFATTMLKNDGTTNFAIHAGNGQAGPLTTIWSGPLPSSPLNPNPPSVTIPADNPPNVAIVNPPLSGYQPTKKEGAIILGIGGDGSNDAVGSFFEGVMTTGYTPDAADAAVQANIVAVQYKMN